MFCCGLYYILDYILEFKLLVRIHIVHKLLLKCWVFLFGVQSSSWLVWSSKFLFVFCLTTSFLDNLTFFICEVSAPPPPPYNSIGRAFGRLSLHNDWQIGAEREGWQHSKIYGMPDIFFLVETCQKGRHPNSFANQHNNIIRSTLTLNQKIKNFTIYLRKRQIISCCFSLEP